MVQGPKPPVLQKVRSLFCKVCGDLVAKFYGYNPYKVVQEVPCMRCQYKEAKKQFDASVKKTKK
jgi:hypothetical protein